MTQYYIGVKIIEAWEMERNGEPGYAVKYSDNYTSWSPKKVFEEAYLPMGQDPSKVNPQMVNEFLSEPPEPRQIDEKTTLVRQETITGFTQFETSSCVDPQNYDQAVGTEICAKRIRERIWAYLGFVLQWGRFGLRN